jgi:hypothetical protein
MLSAVLSATVCDIEPSCALCGPDSGCYTLTRVSIELPVWESWLELTGTQIPQNRAILDQGKDPAKPLIKDLILRPGKKKRQESIPEVSDRPPTLLRYEQS